MATEYVQWGSVSTAQGGGGDKSDYLKLESGGKYRIRPIFDPVQFFKYFHKKDGRLRTAICSDPATCPVRDRHSDLQKPSMRFAAYVIDRADGKLKILEAPQSVFRPIGSSFEATGKNPGSSKDGSDWQVTVTGKGLSTKYDVAFAGSTPLSADEKSMIKESLDGDMKKLQKLYKTDTPEEIEEKLFGDPKKKEAEAEAPAPAPTPSYGQVDDAPDVDTGGDDFDTNW
jgi:hypothetical protein